MMRAVLLDVLGTLVSMEPPGPLLRAELRRRGVEVTDRAAAAAFQAEIDYYLGHHLEGRDPASLGALRDRCASVLGTALGVDVEPGVVRSAMLASLRFSAYHDAPLALGELRSRSVRLVAASNWDCSLPQVLGEAGLAPLLDGVVASADVGVAKPDAGLFQAALAAAGCRPGEAIHVGDSVEHDVEGALAAGIRPVLLDRTGQVDTRGVQPIRSLEELPALTLAGP